MKEELCQSCSHNLACSAWVRHGEMLYRDFAYHIGNCPYYDPVNQAEWIETEYNDSYAPYYLFHCSKCNTPNARERNYCPMCGAKMSLSRE